MSNKTIYFVLLCSFLVFGRVRKETIQITIPHGTLRGTVMSNYDGGKFYGFTSVPFARPPVGDNRFKVAVENKPWRGILDATIRSPDCMQPNAAITGMFGQEDCLYLRIFTNSTNKAALKSVMVYIFGGRYTSGSSNEFGPEFLMTENVVLVLLNYRLGVYGFINTVNTKNVKPSEMFGNIAFKDQVLALKWIQKNIEYFGGDPRKVTLFGHSAGGAAVHAHMLSPLSTGLFQRAITMSATMLHSSVLGKHDTVTPLAEYLGLNTSNFAAMMQGLRNTTNDNFFKAAKALNWFGIYLNDLRPTGLIVEQSGPNSFIDNYPLKIIQSGKYNKVPFMIGNDNREGLIIYGKEYQLPEYKYFDTHIPFALRNRNVVQNKLKQFYQLYSKTNHDNLIEFFSYGWYKYNTFRAALEHAKVQKQIYYYEFSGDGKLNFLKAKMPSIQKEYGACHGDELGSLFAWNGLPARGSVEEKLMRMVVNVWVNFAKTGKPIENLDIFQEKVHNYVNITNTGFKIGVLNDKSFIFWDELYRNYSDGLY